MPNLRDYINSKNIALYIKELPAEQTIEFDKQSGSSKLDTYMVDKGIAVTTMVKEDPVTVDTKVSVMPIVSFDRADEVFFATVY